MYHFPAELAHRPVGVPVAVGGKAIRMTKEGRIYGLAFGYAHTRPPKKEIMTSYSALGIKLRPFKQVFLPKLIFLLVWMDSKVGELSRRRLGLSL